MEIVKRCQTKTKCVQFRCMCAHMYIYICVCRFLQAFRTTDSNRMLRRLISCSWLSSAMSAIILYRGQPHSDIPVMPTNGIFLLCLFSCKFCYMKIYVGHYFSRPSYKFQISEMSCFSLAKKENDSSRGHDELLMMQTCWDNFSSWETYLKQHQVIHSTRCSGSSWALPS